jgi:hypothetical protein
VFVQCGVIGSDSSRDGRRQTRIVSGAQDGLRIYTVSHHLGGEELRLDATVRYQVYLITILLLQCTLSAVWRY